MKNKIGIKNILIVLLTITIIVVCMGFIFLSNKLQAKNNEQPVLKVEFTKIKRETSVQGGIESPSEKTEIINEGMTAKFKFILNTPQDELSYTIIIKNTGTLPAKIVDILSSPNYTDDEINRNNILPVVITQTPITNNKLKPGEELNIKLVVSYGMGGENIQQKIPYELTILATTIN